MRYIPKIPATCCPFALVVIVVITLAMTVANASERSPAINIHTPVFILLNSRYFFFSKMKTGLWILIVGLCIQFLSVIIMFIFMATMGNNPSAGAVVGKILCVYILGSIGGLVTFVGVVWCVVGYARCKC
jgi:hypothetical protein